MGQIGNININFTVYSDSPSHLYIKDLSDWVYAEDLPSYIEIILPGSKKTKNFSFVKFKTNIFNSHNLGLSCLSADCTEEEYVDLPDGIYTINLKSGFENICKKKHYLKTDIFEIEYAKILIDKGTNVTQNFINYMTKVSYTLDVAKSHIVVGNIKESSKYFEEAKELLKRYQDCKDCI